MFTDLVGKLSRFAGAPDAFDAAIECLVVDQQADDDEGFAVEVEEETG
jgi:hypothetical protein